MPHHPPRPKSIMYGEEKISIMRGNWGKKKIQVRLPQISLFLFIILLLLSCWFVLFWQERRLLPLLISDIKSSSSTDKTQKFKPYFALVIFSKLWMINKWLTLKPLPLNIHYSSYLTNHKEMNQTILLNIKENRISYKEKQRHLFSC